MRGFMPIFASMKTVRLILLLLILGVATASAQRRLVVADVETNEVIAKANVEGSNFHAVTDSTGCFLAPDSCHSLVFSHVNYESRIVNIEEVRDTVFLISKLLSLQEVVVFGKVRYEDDGLDELRKSLHLQRSEAQLAAADPSKAASIPIGMLAKLLPKKWRPGYKKEQRKKLHEEILRDY